MHYLQDILLGIIQGLTEFLPISSTAHLTIAGKLLHLIDPAKPEEWTAFIAVIQLGTVLAVLVYFAKDLVNIIKDFITENLGSNRKSFKQQGENSRVGWLIIAGSIPVGIFGLVLKKIIEGSITKELNVIALSMIVLAIILFWAEKTAKFKKEMKDITLKDSIIIGLAQCLALIPGSSRSGTTITAGLFLGIRRDTAARFSFLLSIPAVLASGLFEFAKHIKYFGSGHIAEIIIANIAAFIVGFISIAVLLRYLKTKTTLVFVIYRLILGILIFILLFAGIISA